MGLFKEEAVGVTASFGPEDRQDEAEEKCEEREADDGKQPALADITLAVGGLRQHDHPEDDGSVEEHDEVGLEDKLALKMK